MYMIRHQLKGKHANRREELTTYSKYAHPSLKIFRAREDKLKILWSVQVIHLSKFIKDVGASGLLILKSFHTALLLNQRSKLNGG